MEPWIPVLAGAILALAVGLLFIRRNRRALIRLARRHGLARAEASLLDDVARVAAVRRPGSLFVSPRRLADAFDSYLEHLQRSLPDGTGRASAVAVALALRGRMAVIAENRRSGIKSTYVLESGQTLRLHRSGGGFFLTEVVAADQGALVIAFPRGENADGLDWDGVELDAYFWREHDAGYSFRTRVLRAVREPHLAVLMLAHATGLERSQLRRFLRIDCDLPAVVQPVVFGRHEGRREARVLPFAETAARVVNLGENGLAVVPETPVETAGFLRVAFSIGNAAGLEVIGRVPGRPDRKNRGAGLNLEVVHASPEVRNAVSLYIFQRKQADLP